MSLDQLRSSTALDGRVALVTGASRGIGEAIARRLAAYGARVVVSSRKQEAVDAVAAAIVKEGGEAAPIAAHVGDPAAIRRLVDATVERYGGLDIVVNNAATNPAFGPVIAVDEGLFDKIYEINVKGPFMVAKAAQPIMAARGGGVIVNIASMAGLSPEPMLGFYSVSKAALIMLTKVLAAEWGAANIRVNAVLPGLIKTKFSRALWENDAILKRTLDQQAIPTLGEPEDVAGIVAFLASDAARFMTGGLYTVDGGYTI